MRRAILLFLFVLCLCAMSRDLHAQTVFVSTGSGSQILSVNGQTGTFTVVPQTAEIFDLGFSPEGLVIGPDSKLYITDPNHGVIWRMNQDGSQTEPVYTVQACEAVICPNTVQGPSFSSSSTGDLYFNTEGSGEFSGNGVFAITSVGTTAFQGTINPPVNIVTSTCPTCFTPGDGAGTAFDSANNLLFVEQSGGTNPNSVLSVSPPYASSSPNALLSGLTSPTGVALNPAANGLTYVANASPGSILQISTGLPYFNSFGNSNGNCVENAGAPRPELPLYMQFDGTGHLFVVTAINSSGNCGQLWRIDPPIGPGTAATGTLVLDLVSAFNGDPPLVTSDQAVGVAIGPASNTVTVGPFAVAPGTTVNFIDGTFINQKVAIPPDAIMNGVAFMQMSFIQVPPAVFNSTRLTGVEGNTFSGGNQGPFISPPSTCTVITGTANNSNCMVMEAQCFDVNHAPLTTCKITAPTTLITLTTSYETPFPQPTPGFLIADDNANNWANILIGYNATAFNVNDPIMVGGTKSCQEDTVIVNLGGPVTPSPASVNLGNVPVFGFPISVVTVTNTGTAALTIKSKLAAVPGGDSDDFGALSLCLKPLQPTKSCFILVSFFADPDDFNLQTATLNITNSASGSPQLIVPLTATVVVPKKK